MPDLRGESPLCEFTHPYAWREIGPMLLSGDELIVREALGLLEERDRALRDHLANRPCCDCTEPPGST